MIHFDRWHRLEIDEEGATLTGHEQCPTFPDGPEPDDTGYGCLTYANIRRAGDSSRYPEVTQLGPGTYDVRYWWTDGDDDGYTVKRR